MENFDTWTSGYREKLEDILGSRFYEDGTLRLHFEYDTKVEAQNGKKKLILMQKQLRQVRKEVGLVMTDIRNFYSLRRVMYKQGSGPP